MPNSQSAFRAKFRVTEERDMTPSEEIAYYSKKIIDICNTSGERCFPDCVMLKMSECPFGLNCAGAHFDEILKNKEVIE